MLFLLHYYKTGLDPVKMFFLSHLLPIILLLIFETLRFTVFKYLVCSLAINFFLSFQYFPLF